jgi:DNA-directed RNA polymerase specialized sigma24 family protein
VQAELEREYVEFVSARLAAMRRLAYLLTGDGHRADDLVQQAFTALYVHWRRARAATHLDSYVRSIWQRTRPCRSWPFAPIMGLLSWFRDPLTTTGP